MFKKISSAIFIAILCGMATATYAANGAQYISQDLPQSMVIGEPHGFQITMKNTGTTPWTGVDGYQLSLKNPDDEFIWGIGAIPLVPGEWIAPGAVKIFTATTTASISGEKQIQWQMEQVGVGMFGEVSASTTISVVPEGEMAAVVALKITSITALMQSGNSLFPMGVRTKTVVSKLSVSVNLEIGNLTQNKPNSDSIVAAPENELVFKLTIKNNGGVSLENVRVRDTLPKIISGAGNLKIDGEPATGNITKELGIGSLAVGQSKNVTFTGQVAKAGDSVVNGAKYIDIAVAYTDAIWGKDTALITITK